MARLARLAAIPAAVAGAAAAALIGRRQPIPAELLDRWPELAGARWRRGGLPPRVPQWWFGSGAWTITLGRTVFLGPDAPLDPELLLHELRHVQQFRASLAFPLRYLWHLVVRGYRDNPFEIDARHYARERLHAPRSAHTSST